MTSHWLFRLRGDLNSRQKIVLAIGGIVFFISVWALLTTGENPVIRKSVMPSPLRVLTAYEDLFSKYEIFKNISRSIGLNLGGYIKAILYAIPIGFLIGLVPLFRGAFQRMVDAVRFLPLTALTPLFIIWFGIHSEQKINFLAFGIFIYLLPIVIQRIDEVDDVYLKTVHTLGAKYWDTIFTVYFPSVISRLSDDIRILTAISWTYIIVAETSADQGGIGALIYRVGQRFSRVDITIACLIIIMVIGIFQDKVFSYLDRTFFPHKYQLKIQAKEKKEASSIAMMDTVWSFVIQLSIWIFLGAYILLTINEFYPLIGDIQPMSYLFGDTLWTIHVVFVVVLIYRLYMLYNKYIQKT